MTSDNRDYYQILGVPQEATFEEIRAAFRERAREYHPDRNPSPDAVDRMQEINEAYEVLRDEQQRVAYDRARRTLGASAEELARAKAMAAVVLGQMAFTLGFAIATRIYGHWPARLRRLEDVPIGVWHAAYEVALESVLTGRDEAEIRQAALDAAWSAVQYESARLAYRHALAERAQTFTESFAVDIEVNILGSSASILGFALGQQRIQESLPASAWNQADEAIRRSLNRSILLRGGVVTPQTLRDNLFINSVLDDAAQEANRALQPHAESIGRQIGRSPNRAGAVVPSAGAGDGCGTLLAWIIGLLAIGAIVWILVGLSSSSQYDLITDMESGDCIDQDSLDLAECSHFNSLRVWSVYRFPPDSSFPTGQQFDEKAEEFCPFFATSFVYPSEEAWQDLDDRAMACVARS